MVFFFLFSQIKLKYLYFKIFENDVISKSVNDNFKNKANKLVLNGKKQNTFNQFVACKENIRKSWQILSKLSEHNKPYNVIKSSQPIMAW